MRYIKLLIALLLAITPWVSRAQIDHYPKWSNNFTSLTYNLNDLDQFAIGSYGYCKWGTLQDRTNFYIDRNFFFTPLTKGPYNNSNTDLFIAYDTDSFIEGHAFPTQTTWYSNALYFGGISNYRLYRYLHFRNELIDAATDLPLTGNESKLIILFHGWNPESNFDAYSGNEFTTLVNNLKAVTSGTDWKVVRYRWEADSDTGPVNLSAAINGTEAAEIGHQHGQHLGQVLSSTYPNLEKVHLISHSAGSWAARGTLKHLQNNRPDVVVQMTLLDPFMPNAILSIGSSLGTAAMNITLTYPRPLLLGPLENYYSVDSFVLGTQETFFWANSGTDRNVKIDHVSYQGSVGYVYYQSHQGPIAFYAETITHFHNPSLAIPALDYFNLDLRPDPYTVAQIGWNNSLFLNEPVFTSQPQSQNAKVNTSLKLSAPATSRKNIIRSGSASTSMTWLWFKDNEYIQSTTAPTLTIQSAKNTDSGLYCAAIFDAAYPANITVSDYAEVTVLPAQTASQLEIWRATNFPSSTATAGAGANNVDADNDGLANLLEYALGTNATITNTTPVTVAVDASGVLKLSFPHIADASLVYTVKGTNDLSVGFGSNPVGSFTGFTAAGVTNYLDTGFPLASNTKRFLRLEVSAP